MNAEHLHKLWMTRPFSPFRIRLTDGSTHDVMHPEGLWITRTLVGISSGTAKPFEELAPDSFLVAPEQVVSVEMLQVFRQVRQREPEKENTEEAVPSSFQIPTRTAKAVFLDRDGVLNKSVIRNGKPFPPQTVAEFELLPGVKEACADLKKAGYLLVVCTNQPDVGRGTQDKEIVEQMHAYLCKELPIDRVEVCFHPGGGESHCDCRKPKPGMVVRAARLLNINTRNSWMIGDRWRDINCGKAAGCKTIFIDYNYEEDLEQEPDHICSSLREAVDIILHYPHASAS